MPNVQYMLVYKFKKTKTKNWLSLVSNVLSLQARRPEFESQNPQSWAWEWIVFAAMGRQRQMEPWSKQVRQFGLFGELQTNEKPCFKRKKKRIRLMASKG